MTRIRILPSKDTALHRAARITLQCTVVFCLVPIASRKVKSWSHALHSAERGLKGARSRCITCSEPLWQWTRYCLAVLSEAFPIPMVRWALLKHVFFAVCQNNSSQRLDAIYLRGYSDVTAQLHRVPDGLMHPQKFALFLGLSLSCLAL